MRNWGITYYLYHLLPVSPITCITYYLYYLCNADVHNIILRELKGGYQFQFVEYTETQVIDINVEFYFFGGGTTLQT